MNLILARRFGEALVAGLIAGVVLLVLAPVFIGWRPYTVLTGSMRPEIQPGDVVMDRPVRITDAHIGDVVTFSDPTRGHKLVTHRIRSIVRGPISTQVETRGDANSASERWTIQTKDRVGKVVYVLPKVGYVATIIRNPFGIIGLVVIPILLLAAGVIRKIWQDDQEEAAIEAAEGGPDPDDAPPIFEPESSEGLAPSKEPVPSEERVPSAELAPDEERRPNETAAVRSETPEPMPAGNAADR